ncbi:MAG TPA: choice-of-anchor tandem repeat GloVer-containing protein [Candidatus Sulfotelmatobacter sp.]
MVSTHRQFFSFRISILILLTAAATAQTETVLHSFVGKRDGGYPASRPVLDPQGNLYGITSGGRNTEAGYGTVYKVGPGGRETVLHNFTGGADGATPTGALIRDAQGNLYGTTGSGGSLGGDCVAAHGCGTVFEVSPTGTETVLYAFPSINPGFPTGPLARDASGNLYGSASNIDFGVIFKLTAAGALTEVHNFTGKDGWGGYGGLNMDGQGNLYGTSVVGGSSSCGFGCGVIYELSATNEFHLLYSFSGSDGYEPIGELVRDSEGNLYGMTIFGGSNPSCTDELGCGTVFEVTSDGTERVLYSFSGGADGDNPQDGLVRDKEGNLYGTTFTGGKGNCSSGLGCGVVFKLSPEGTENVLYSFSGGADGGNPQSGLALDAQGNLYGTTLYYGANGYGTVFRVTP